MSGNKFLLIPHDNFKDFSFLFHRTTFVVELTKRLEEGLNILFTNLSLKTIEVIETQGLKLVKSTCIHSQSLSLSWTLHT